MDLDRTLRKVDEFIVFCERAQWIQGNAGPGFGATDEWQHLELLLVERLPLIEKIAMETDPRLAVLLRKPSASAKYYFKLQAARELRGALLSQEEAAEILAPQGPVLMASRLHPWVWDHATALWSDGYRRAALQAAATALFDSHIPAKLGRERDVKGGKDLMGQAFSVKVAEPGAPRLRFKDIPAGSAEWTSAHEGAMHLGQGCAQAIRNPSTHDLSEPEEQEALEMLAALSLVARLVDKAEVDRAS